MYAGYLIEVNNLLASGYERYVVKKTGFLQLILSMILTLSLLPAFGGSARGQTPEDAEVGHRTTSLCQLGHIAIQAGRKLKWDPDAERFINDDTANRLLSRPMRSPWRL